MKKKFICVALIAIIACSMFALTACNKDKSDDMAYVSLDINPAIELVVDKDNNVVSVRGENEDGQVLLYEESGIKGVKVDEAINKITDLAVKYGYLDENNKVVNTIVTSTNEAFGAKVNAKVNASITDTAADLGLTVTTNSEGAYSLVRKLEEFKAAHPENADIQNLSVAKFKLALSVSETGDVTLEAAVNLNYEELIKKLNDANNKIETYAIEAYNVAKTNALAAYEQATELAVYGEYTRFCVEKIIQNPMLAYYGGTYQIYASAAKGFDVICDVAELATKINNQPLDESKVQAVMTALGLESADVLKNSYGEITINSIDAYADKLFKNSEAGEALEQMKEDLTSAISTLETEVKAKVAEIMETYRPEIETAAESARQIVSAVQNMMTLLPESVKEILNNSTKDLTDILSEIEAMLEDGGIDVQELRDFSDTLEGKAQEYLDKVNGSLTEDDLKELEQRKANVVAKMTEQKKALEKAIGDAEKAAKDYLASLKAARTPAEQ